MRMFGRELTIDQIIGLVETSAKPDDDLVHRAALELIAALRKARRRERAAVEWADTFAHALRYRNDVGGCEAAWLEQYDEWRGPQEAGKGEAK